MAMTLDQRRKAYAASYLRMFAAAVLDEDRVGEALRAAKRIIAGKQHYDALTKISGVPWWFFGITHYRESGCDFTQHPHCGGSLTLRTQDEPKNRPPGDPPFTWHESAVDCYFTLKHLDEVVTWNVVEVLLRFEMFNGFGYRGRRYKNGQEIYSPYLWAGTNQSLERGKFVKDHVFDEDAPDKQLGAVALMLSLRQLGYDLGIEPVKLTNDTFDGEMIRTLKRKLMDLGYTEVGAIDEDLGSRTTAAVSAFQHENHLPVNGQFDAATIAALDTAQKRPIPESRAGATVDDLRNAGSETISLTDKAKKLVTGITMTTAGAKGVETAIEKTDVLQQLQQVAEKAQDASSTISMLSDAVHSLSGIAMTVAGFWWVLIPVGGYAVWRYLDRQQQQRLAEHRAGINTGR